MGVLKERFWVRGTFRAVKGSEGESDSTPFAEERVEESRKQRGERRKNCTDDDFVEEKERGGVWWGEDAEWDSGSGVFG